MHSPTPETHNTVCVKPECYSNCHIDCYLEFSPAEPENLLYCEVVGDDDECKKCGHSYQDHRHFKSLWKQEHTKYESVVTSRIWVHSTTPETLNTSCVKPECYSNCHADCYLEFSLEPENLLFCEVMDDDDDCKRCGHSYQDHRHFESLWKQEDKTEIVVDEEFKQKFLEAKAGEGKMKEVKIRLERAIKGLDEGLNKSLDEISSHTKSYVELSLTGSFTALIKRTVRLLETTSETMRNNKADMATVKVVEGSLTSVKAKLELVTNAAKSRRQVDF